MAAVWPWLRVSSDLGYMPAYLIRENSSVMGAGTSLHSLVFRFQHQTSEQPPIKLMVPK